MELKVLLSEDPAFVLRRADKFLSSKPVAHDLILSILHARVAHADPGRYWIALYGEKNRRRCGRSVTAGIPSYADTYGTASSAGHGGCDCGSGRDPPRKTAV